MFRGPFLACALVGTAILIVASEVRADTSQTAAVSGSAAQLTAAGFPGLNGAAVNVGVIEAGGLANASYGVANPAPTGFTFNNAANTQTTTISFQMQLPNGNPDLPGARFNFPDLGGGNLANGGNALPAGMAVGNHASEVTGVIMGTGVTGVGDRGIATSSFIEMTAFAGSNNQATLQTNSSQEVFNSLNAAPFGQDVQVANMSWGLVNPVVPAANANAYLNAVGYIQAVDGTGTPLYLNATKNGTTTSAAAALKYSNGNAVPMVALTATSGIPVASNNGSSFSSMFTDWAAAKFNSLLVIAGNESNPVTTAAFNATQGYFAPTTVGSAPALHLQAGSPSDDYNSINVGATGQRGAFNGAGQFIPNGTGPLNYGVNSAYNTTNITGGSAIALGSGATNGISPITGYGRLKTDIVAPGGDPGNPANFGAAGTAGTPASFGTAGGLSFGDQFTSTAGGVLRTRTVKTKPGGVVTSQSSTDDTYFGQPLGAPPANSNDVTTNSNYDFGFDGANVDPDGEAGTSFAAPLVTGAASLIYQYGNDNFVPALHSEAVDHRVIKAIILNGATHTYNGQNLMETNGTTPWTRLAGAGTTPVLQGTNILQYPGTALPKVRPGLDPQLGTGMLNVVNSLKNYAAGEQAPGLVNPVGWDSETVKTTATPNSIVDAYTINVPIAGLFQATLDWDDAINNANGGTAGVNGSGTFNGTNTFSRLNLTDLDLYLFSVNPADGSLIQVFDYSTSDIDNVEYLYDNLPAGTYQLDVADAQYAPPSDTVYGLAWTAVPEPASFVLMAVAGVLVLAYRRRRALITTACS
ncbi:MAG TPA: PEP-CTERM sorting domain-containing protein [Pirellulales bacterium]|jgi:hypothetical protein|nr:PEP-CTERM sorting domain-containing protein [Pirellulales bacterium]